MNINSLQEGSIITSHIINSTISKNVSQMTGDKGISPFSEILSEACGKTGDVSSMFQTSFSNYNVQTKVGDCDVPSESWDRNDFPIWEYFKKDSSAECLNKWRPSGSEPPQTDRNVQKGLSQINYGEMVILMPESLQKKMESEPDFAEEVLKKVQKWKEDYDREDNAIAASLGYDPGLNQLSKSYCIQLDENGNVGDYTVVGGGFDDPHDTSVTVISKDDPFLFRKTVRKENQLVTENTVATEKNDIDFESVAPYLMDLKVKKE